MRVFLLFLFFTGIILIVCNEVINAPKQVTVYKYLPRDLDTYLREEPLVSVQFADLFTDDIEPGSVYSQTAPSKTGAVLMPVNVNQKSDAYALSPGTVKTTAAVSARV